MAYALINAFLIDGSGNSEPNKTILINENRIEDVYSGQQVPDGYQTIDLEGRALLPGLIDAHIHIGHSRSEPDRMRYDRFTEPKVSLLAARQVWESLWGGVTTLRDMGARHGQSITIRDAVNAGTIPGSRVVAANESITFTGGHASYQVDGPWAMRAAVRHQVRAGADVIKIGQSNDANYPGFNPVELEAVIDEAHRLGRRVAVHVDKEPALGMSVRAGVDTVEHGFYPYPETLELMLEKGTYWVPTITINRGMRHDEHTPERYEQNLTEVFKTNGIGDHQARRRAAEMREAFEAFPKCFAQAVEMGIKIITGPDGPRADRVPMDCARNEVVKFVDWGMSPEQAIVSATSLAAEALGLDHELGVIRKGYLADLIVLDGDPLEDIETIDSIRLVMKDGCIYRNELQGATEEGF